MRSMAVVGVLAFAFASSGEAGERYRPSDPDHIVLHLPQQAPIGSAAHGITQPSSDPVHAAELANGYLRKARSLSEPRYFGRAEALIAPWLERPSVPAEILRIQADILQNRHDFSGALRLLDRAIDAEPGHARGRLMRATVWIVQGEYAQARPDCVALLTLGQRTLGIVCLAQTMGGTGQLSQAETLLDTLLKHESDSDPELRSWILATLADLADRRGDGVLAERYLREALAATPTEEAVRTRLADVLIAHSKAREAMPLLDVARPSLGLLVYRARVQTILRDEGRAATLRQIGELLRIGARRGERVHLREEALLALDVLDEPARALPLALQNFSTQRETLDARLLVRAALAQGDRAALQEVAGWMQLTGFQDQEIETPLQGSRSLYSGAR